MNVSNTLPPTEGWKAVTLDKTGVPHSYHDKFSMMRGPYQKAWTYRGEFHRPEKPAVLFGENEYYYIMGILHRIDGPAIYPVFKSGYNNSEWYVYGEESNEEMVFQLKQVSQEKGIPFYLVYLMNKLNDFDTDSFADEDYERLVQVPLVMLSDVLHLDKSNIILTDDFISVASFERGNWLKNH